MNSILFISLMNGGAWGGSEELWYQTALYAAQNGYKVGCAFYEWPEKKERIERLKKAGCEVYLFSNRGRAKSNFLERLQYKITKRWVRYYAHSLPMQKYDKTVINLGHLEIIDRYWKRFHPNVKNYTLLFHVLDKTTRVSEFRKDLLRKWLLHAEHNLFASLRIKPFLEEQLAINIPRAATLINPITFKAPDAPTPYPPLRNGNYVFVMLATLDTRRKAQDNLVTALSSPKWKSRNWQLHLYGGGEDEQKLQALIADTQLSEKVFLKGHTKDVKGVLADAHLVLQLTHIDAMPLAVMEALAMAKPIAVSDVGDMTCWVSENRNGWISPTAAVEQMDETLERAWLAREQWEEMGKISFRVFQKKFPAVPEKYLLEQLSA